VDDLADACVYLMQRYNEEELVNIGSGTDVSIAELAEMVKRVVGFPGGIRWDSNKPDGTPRKLLDVTRIRKLGWQAAVPVEQGIASTYDWFLKHAPEAKG
ncbi:MAG: GDP-L-fucose synthase, partial [Verrucomicrobia bacterium]|nr:GDP-L-fucose synthase [Verrucomicrobiota bacterium]